MVHELLEHVTHGIWFKVEPLCYLVHVTLETIMVQHSVEEYQNNYFNQSLMRTRNHWVYAYWRILINPCKERQYKIGSKRRELPMVHTHITRRLSLEAQNRENQHSRESLHSLSHCIIFYVYSTML